MCSDTSQVEEIRLETSGDRTWIRREFDGKQLTVERIDGTAIPEGSLSQVRLSDGRWLLVSSPYERTARMSGFLFTPGSKGLQALGFLDGPGVSAVAAHPEGGFVITGRAAKGGGDLCRFDNDGKRLWWKAVNDYKSVTVTSEGDVAVLGQTSILVFTSEGQIKRTIVLEQAIGQMPNYTADVYEGPDGSILFHDFRGDPQLWVLSKDDSARPLRLRHEDGKAPSAMARWARTDGKGRVWSYDEDFIVRVDGDGVVEHCVGERATRNLLYQPTLAVLDHLGRLLIFDERNGAIHAFDLDGQWLFRCTPGTRDFSSIPYFPHLTVDGNGHILVMTQEHADRPRYVEFDAKGHRIGTREFHGDTVHCIPGERHAWAKRFNEMVRLDALGNDTDVIQRRKDRTWLRYFARSAMAHDGSLVLADTRLNTYASDGTPRSTLRLPDLAGMKGVFDLAYTDDWILLGSLGGGTALVHEQEGLAYRFQLPNIDENALEHDVLVPPDGEGFMIFDRQLLRLTRYAFPE